MNKKKIIIDIDQTGKTEIQFQGFKGRLCFDEAEKIYTSLRKMGIDIEVKEKKQTINIPESIPVNRKIGSS